MQKFLGFAASADDEWRPAKLELRGDGDGGSGDGAGSGSGGPEGGPGSAGFGTSGYGGPEGGPESGYSAGEGGTGYGAGYASFGEYGALGAPGGPAFGASYGGPGIGWGDSGGGGPSGGIGGGGPGGGPGTGLTYSPDRGWVAAPNPVTAPQFTPSPVAPWGPFAPAIAPNTLTGPVGFPGMVSFAPDFSRGFEPQSFIGGIPGWLDAPEEAFNPSFPAAPQGFPASPFSEPTGIPANANPTQGFGFFSGNPTGLTGWNAVDAGMLGLSGLAAPGPAFSAVGNPGVGGLTGGSLEGLANAMGDSLGANAGWASGDFGSLGAPGSFGFGAGNSEGGFFW